MIRAVWSILPLLVVLAAWQAVGMLGLVSPRVMPPLSQTLQVLWEGLATGRLSDHLAASLQRILAGFVIGGALGYLFGLAVARSRIVALLLEPVVIAGYAVPKLAFFPIVVFAVGFGTPSKIAFAAIECFYPVALATIFAVRGVSRNLLWVARNSGAGEWRILAEVILPASLAGLMGGLRIALPIAVTVVTVTEMLGDRVGLGHHITISAAAFRYDQVYAGLLLVGLLGFALDRGFVLLRDRLLAWSVPQ